MKAGLNAPRNFMSSANRELVIGLCPRKIVGPKPPQASALVTTSKTKQKR